MVCIVIFPFVDFAGDPSLEDTLDLGAPPLEKLVLVGQMTLQEE